MISTVLDHGKLVRKRNQLIPLIHLGELLGISYRHPDATEGIVILVESGTVQRCIVVDTLIGKSEVVIKDLGPAFEGQTAMSGAAIMGDGRVALILDVDAIVSQSQSGHRSQNTSHRKESGGTISDATYKQIAGIVYRNSRINLGAEKHNLVVGRLAKRCRQLRLHTFEDYCPLLTSGDGKAELATLIDLISTNHTHFFREAHHFDFVANTVLPEFKTNPRNALETFRCWSAAASSGEE
eukprot:gene57968-77357_t